MDDVPVGQTPLYPRERLDRLDHTPDEGLPSQLSHDHRASVQDPDSSLKGVKLGLETGMSYKSRYVSLALLVV